ncbi:hypothetical protein V6N12_044203 [Hibiscus sabdariffa]|uniref:Uncharacterized protein n=1 Tax=Hibiscus sabdariffa TaxID=183260 RepID=A0ABR2DGK3_9ROSI
MDNIHSVRAIGVRAQHSGFGWRDPVVGTEISAPVEFAIESKGPLGLGNQFKSGGPKLRTLKGRKGYSKIYKIKV